MRAEASDSVAEQPLVITRRRALIQSGVVVLAWLLATLLLGLYTLWIWPQAVGHQQSGLHLSGGDSWNVAGAVLIWVSTSLVVVGFQVFRLRAEQRWALDYPYSPWRTLKSVALVVAWTGIASYNVNWTVAHIVFPNQAAIPTPNPVYALIGPVAGAVGLTMMLIDINRGERKARFVHEPD